MTVLLAAVLVGAVILIFAVDRLLKLRVRARRMRTMRRRLAAATVRAEEQQEQRKDVARASGALTSVMPAIERPPLALPDMPPADRVRPQPGRDHAGQDDPGSGYPRRRRFRTGEHATRSRTAMNHRPDQAGGGGTRPLKTGGGNRQHPHGT
jgi:hypothetical protein